MPDIRELSPAEERLVRAVEEGMIADFEADGPRPEVRAEVVRRLLLGVPLLEGGPPRATPVTGVRMRSAVVAGILDLDGATLTNQGVLPPLSLEQCLIHEPMKLEAVRIRRLSLAGSRFQALRAPGLHCSGVLDLTRVEPVHSAEEDEPQICHVELPGAVLHGGIRAPKAKLVAPSRPDDEVWDRSAGLTQFALNLKNATVRGDLELQPEFEAIGGVTIHGIDLTGDVWLDGARLIGDEGEALRAQGARVGGAIVIRPDKRPTGEVRVPVLRGGRDGRAAVWMLSARLGSGLFVGSSAHQDAFTDIVGNIVLDGAVVEGAVDIRDLRQPDGSLMAHRCRFSGKAAFYGLEMQSGTLVLRSCDIGDDLLLGSVDVSGGIRASDLQVGNDLDLRKSKVHDAVDLTGSRIRGHLILEKVDTSDHPLHLRSLAVGGAVTLVECRLGSVYGDDLEVDGNLYLCSSQGLQNLRNDRSERPPPGQPEYGSLRINDAWFQQVRVGGSLRVDGVTATGLVTFGRARVQGMLKVASCEFFGVVKFTGARIGSDFGFNHVHFRQRVVASGTNVKGSLELRSTKLARNSSFEGALVEGSAALEDLTLGRTVVPRFERRGEGPRPVDHSFRNLACRGELLVRDVHPSGWTPPIIVTDALRRLAHENPAFKRRNLACYRDWDLVEAVSPDPTDEGREARFAFLWKDADEKQTAQLWPMDGSSPAIHLFNTRTHLRLDSEREVLDYLKFFCGYVWGDEGPFRIVDPEALPRWQPVDGEDEPDSAAATKEQPAASPSDRGEPEEHPDASLSAVGPPPQLDPPSVTLVSEAGERDTRAWVDAAVLYGNHLFMARFRVLESGMVEMPNDSHLGRLSEELPESIEKPFRLVAPTSPIAESLIGDGWEPVDASSGAVMAEALAALVQEVSDSPYLAELSNIAPEIDLSNAVVARLNDRDGSAWGVGFRFQLDGLSYQRGPRGGALWSRRHSVQAWDTPESHRQAEGEHLTRADRRLAFLRLQYPSGRPTVEDFRPQPYEVAAAAFRNEGSLDDARKILSEKLSIESELKNDWPRRAWRLYGFLFDYGLSPARALVTLAAFWLVGFVGSLSANQLGVLVVDFTPTSGVVVTEPLDARGVRDRTATRFAVIPEEGVESAVAVPCGDMIFEAFYALDVMVPVLDFYQEKNCKIGGVTPPPPAWMSGRLSDGSASRRGRFVARVVWEVLASPPLWAALKTVYSILGAVVVSVAILTFSGLARRHVEV